MKIESLRFQVSLIALLQARGIDKGDRIAWLGKNRDIYFLLYIAAARMGAVMVPIGWRLAPREIAYILSDTEAKLLFADADFIAVAHQVAGEVPANPGLGEAVSRFQAWLLERKRQREEDLLCLSPAARYLAFLEREPGLAGRLALKEVAGYLRITPVALSRIRRRLRAEGRLP